MHSFSRCFKFPRVVLARTAPVCPTWDRKLTQCAVGSFFFVPRRSFTRWKLRKLYATTCQRVFRGHKGRKRARKRMVKVMQRRLKEGAALAANAAREAARYDSEKLRFLKAELAALEAAKRNGDKEIDAHLHLSLIHI